MIEANATMQRADAAIVAGEQAAFGLLVDQHYAAVLRFLTRQTGDPELAADLTQSCFLDAYRSRQQLADPDAFAPWLFSIARNQLRMEWRRQRLRRLLSLDWLTAGGDSGGATGGGTGVAALRQEDETGNLAERDHIQEVLNGMSPTLREALLLHSLCGFRGGEVAEILGISTAAARKRIVRAEAEFRDRFGDRRPPFTKATDHVPV